MEFRHFGNLGWKVSALGFGCMRLPLLPGKTDPGQIDEPQAVRMIRRAIEAGVNYVDTAYSYHDSKSEVVVGRALRGGYREKVRLATKSPVWLIEKAADFDRFLNEQLTRLQTDHIDFYLLHALDGKRWRETILRCDVLVRALAAIRDGRIGHLGFSFHDTYGSFVEILNGSELWDFCQIQYNYLDTENQAGTRGLKLAAARGLAVVIMEPLLGGRLAHPPAAVREDIDGAAVKRSPVEWALHWVWDQPEVSVVLSGMSSMPQVEDNLASACRSRIGSFTAADQAVMAKLRQRYRQRTAIPCTKCNYCMPCPSGVNIPANFAMFNDAHIHDDVRAARTTYYWTREQERAVNCTACHVCEEQCPQKIPISEWMPKVHALLAS